MPKDKELEAIRDLEDALREADRIEINMKSDSANNAVEKVINLYGVSIYTSEKAMQEMIDSLKAVLEAYIIEANKRGRLLGKKAMEKFLDESEAKDYTQKALRLIEQATEKRVAQRLELAFEELEKQHNILKSDINIYKKQRKIAGFTDKQTLSRLVKMRQSKTDMLQSFANEVKKVNVAASRREESQAEIDEYQTKVLPDEEWVWISISTKPCPDCMDRAGVQLPLERWMQYGIPGSGNTICGVFCRCKLRPISIAKDAHEEIKNFRYDKDRGVLITANEKRVFNAKSNQYK